MSVHVQPRVLYDAEFRTFSLYPGNSLYVFSISPELSLENLYWGKVLTSGFDLRYVSQSSRLAHFSTVEQYKIASPPKKLDSAETFDDLRDIWNRNASAGVDHVQSAETRERIRNRAWRKMPYKLKALAPEVTKPRSIPIPSSPSIRESINKTRSKSYSSLEELSTSSETSLHMKTTTSTVSKQTTIPQKVQASKRIFERTGGKLGKGGLCVEYSDHGTGDFRSPSFSVLDNVNGSTISPLRYHSHRIFAGKEVIPGGLPSIRCPTKADATTLIVTMVDEGSGLEVELVYVVMHDYDVLTRRAVFRNADDRPVLSATHHVSKEFIGDKVLLKASSMTVDFDGTSSPFHLVELSGSWGRERYVKHAKLSHGSWSFESTRGVSGHQHNPFAAVTVGPPNESEGETKGFCLVYSGNFLVEAVISEVGRLRVNMGIHPKGLQWHLGRGHSFYTPEAVLVRSDEGLGGMSRTFHRLFLDCLIPRTWSDENPPVLLNTWEAKYFNINHANVVELARDASQLGIDMIVVDDGWFGLRNDDSTSLGDWTPNPAKFPLGLGALADDVNAVGCKLGLWFEPEMISGDSNLFRLHPDWFLRVPERPHQIGRNQFVLDLSRKSVRDYLFEAISSILKSANIEYIKWDMNRPLTEVFSQRELDYANEAQEERIVSTSTKSTSGKIRPKKFTWDSMGIYSPGKDKPATTCTCQCKCCAEMRVAECTRVSRDVWQSETSHLCVLGVYDLQHRITSAFPNVLLENCASGGGRFDPGMLYFSPQIWCSDNTDAVARLKIQYGTSLAYPARCIGAHVSTVPNHITGNTTRSRTRGFVAMCGTYGFELDTLMLSASEREEFREQIKVFRTIVAPIVYRGDLYRLWNPFEVSWAAWMYVTRDKQQAIVFAFSVNSDHWSNLVPRLLLRGLLPQEQYEITEPIPNNMSQGSGNLKIVTTEVPVYQLGYPSVVLTGDILMSCGLPIKFYTLDDSVMFHLSRVDRESPASSTPRATRSRQPSLALDESVPPSSSPSVATTVSTAISTTAHIISPKSGAYLSFSQLKGVVKR